MALFDLECSECKHQFEGNVKISEDSFSEPCPNCGVAGKVVKVFLTTAKIVSGVNLRTKHSQGFKEVMQKVKKANPLGNFDGELVP